MNDPIRHIVVLIMENHSFDQMLGCLKAVYPQLEGIDPQNPNSNTDDLGTSYAQHPTTERQMLLDPHHEVIHVKTQLENANQGFVRDFVTAFPDSNPADRQFVMGYYPLDFLPALHTLARDFTICDHWFSSLPGPTWPNRFFALTGTSHGQVAMPGNETHKVDLPGWFEQNQTTLFDRLNEKGIPWKVYFHDAPQTWALVNQRKPENVSRYFYINRFHADARGLAEEFPAFCLIEPNFMGFDENDDHPPHDIMKAEKLIADVYNSLRSNPDLWRSTLLVIFYDEHGGFYDHVIPPAAVPPDDHDEEYTFDQFGVRVPALLISPWVKRGVEQTQFDHTSVLKYLSEKWELGELGRRTKTARSIGVAIRPGEPMREDTIARINLTSDQLTPPNLSLEENAQAVESAHHKALATLGAWMKAETFELLPRIVTRVAFVQWMINSIDHGVSWLFGVRGTVNISPTQPDHVSGKQRKWARVHRDFTQFLIHQKSKSISALAQRIRDKSLPVSQRDHAIRTLANVTGRKFHTATKPLQPALQSSSANFVVGEAPQVVPPQQIDTARTETAVARADEWLKSNHF